MEGLSNVAGLECLHQRIGRGRSRMLLSLSFCPGPPSLHPSALPPAFWYRVVIAFQCPWLPDVVASEQLNSPFDAARSEEHTSELQSRLHLVCRLLLEKKKTPGEPKRLETHCTLTIMLAGGQPTSASYRCDTCHSRHRAYQRRHTSRQPHRHVRVEYCS